MDARFAARSKLIFFLFYLNICHLVTIHRTAFHSFCLFDFMTKIEKMHSIHIKGR